MVPVLALRMLKDPFGGFVSTGALALIWLGQTSMNGPLTEVWNVRSAEWCGT